MASRRVIWVVLKVWKSIFGHFRHIAVILKL